MRHQGAAAADLQQGRGQHGHRIAGHPHATRVLRTIDKIKKSGSNVTLFYEIKRLKGQ
jgi:hypothetical protein